MQSIAKNDPIEEKILKETFGTARGGNSKKSLEDNNIIYISYLEDSNYILEEINTVAGSGRGVYMVDPGDIKFIKFSKDDGSYEMVDEYLSGDKIYKPLVDDTLKKGGVSLPSGVEEYGTTGKLINEISEFIFENCEIPKFFEKLLPHVVMFYWVYEKFPFIPYIQFVGGTGTGKTTAMETLGSISYKSIDTTGSLTISSMFRTATSWKGTLLIDEFDSLGDKSNEIVSFLKSGVSNRLLLRTEGDIKREVMAYIVKSPKMFTSEEPMEDAGLQSRTFVIRMQKNKRRIPLYKLLDYHKQADSIRNKLLLWRMRNINKINLNDIKYGFPELEGFDRRVQQIITPIYYFSEESSRIELVEFAKQQQEETWRERRESLAGQIFVVISESGQSTVPLSSITAILNNGKTNYLISEKKVGNMVRKVLGFNIERLGHDNISSVIIDPEHLGEQRKYYGLYTPPEPLQVLQVSQNLEL